MEIIGNIVLYFIVSCAVAGGIASIVKPDCELAQKFQEGIKEIGPIFLSVAGIFASVPYIVSGISFFLSPVYKLFGSDLSLAATSILAVDMGGYQVAKRLACDYESWIMSMFVGFTSGATIVFSIPVGLRMISNSLKENFAFGMMSGFLTVPVAVFVSSIFAMAGHITIREEITTAKDGTYSLNFRPELLFYNLLPLLLFCILLAAGLFFVHAIMIRAFQIFGRFLDIFSKFFLVLFILEHFTGAISWLLGKWPFEPIFADSVESVRAIEAAGYTGLMLAGAFPMVYLIQRYFGSGIERICKHFSVSADLAMGILTSAANVLALYPILSNMKERDQVQVIAFSVCGAFAIGDHLAFSANFQPSLILVTFLGKMVGGIFATWIAGKLYDKRKKQTSV